MNATARLTRFLTDLQSLDIGGLTLCVPRAYYISSQYNVYGLQSSLAKTFAARIRDII